MSDVWTEPAHVALDQEADPAAHNDEVLANLRHLKKEDDTRGIIAWKIATFTSTHTVSGRVTSMDLPGRVFVRSDRDYHICHHASVGVSGVWNLEAQANGVVIARLGNIEDDNIIFDGVGLWRPKVTAAYDVSLYAVEATAGTFADEGASNTPRTFYVEDIGPRRV